MSDCYADFNCELDVTRDDLVALFNEGPPEYQAITSPAIYSTALKGAKYLKIVAALELYGADKLSRELLRPIGSLGDRLGTGAMFHEELGYGNGPYGYGSRAVYTYPSYGGYSYGIAPTYHHQYRGLQLRGGTYRPVYNPNQTPVL